MFAVVYKNIADCFMVEVEKRIAPFVKKSWGGGNGVKRMFWTTSSLLEIISGPHAGPA